MHSSLPQVLTEASTAIMQEGVQRHCPCHPEPACLQVPLPKRRGAGSVSVSTSMQCQAVLCRLPHCRGAMELCQKDGQRTPGTPSRWLIPSCRILMLSVPVQRNRVRDPGEGRDSVIRLNYLSSSF